MFPPSIKKLIDIFSKFPTIGPRTASRFVFYLIKQPDNSFNDFITALEDLKKKIKTCAFCFNPFESIIDEDILCPICKNGARDKSTLCIIEKENDLISIENTNKYKGIYFILGGTVSGLKEEDIKKIRASELEERLKNPKIFGILGADFKEIIMATNPTTEGETTYLYLERKIKALNLKDIKITRLGRGLPIGGELEYADEETLESALEGRK